MSRRLAALGLTMGLCLPASAAPVYFAGEVAGVGDPNPFFQDGIYSVFYLKNTGRHPWWVTQTSDLVSWSAPIEAVGIGEAGTRDYWTGSGSIVADPAGGYRIYYTGHDPEAEPKEVVMEARAPALTGPWSKVPETTFAGLPQYDQWDFRDPFVFWNGEAGAWWMLLTTRQAGRAAIGLYTSPDLGNWTAAAPLYSEDSLLNLEVPDLFEEAGDWFLLYSDQRSESRQVRYLTASQSGGSYAYRRYDALDGRAFYAGKSAGTGDQRLLFGWLAHKNLRKDAMDLVWGGDLVVHALSRSEDGTLAVHLPQGIANQFDRKVAMLSPDALDLGTPATALRARVEVAVAPGTQFGVTLTAPSGRVSTLALDTNQGQATFLYNGVSQGAPRVAFPASADGRYALDLVIDPELGLGIVYVNDFRALSFRYYHVGATSLTLFAQGGFASVSGAVFTRSTDLGMENNNG